MNCTIVFDAKTVLALGVSTALVILARKLDSSGAEKVLASFGKTCMEQWLLCSIRYFFKGELNCYE